MTNESLKNLQAQLELAYVTSSSSSTGPGGLATGALLSSSIAVPGGLQGNNTLNALLETKDARIQNLEKEVLVLESELQRIKESGGKLREQLLKATVVPSGQSHQQQGSFTVLK